MLYGCGKDKSEPAKSVSGQSSFLPLGPRFIKFHQRCSATCRLLTDTDIAWSSAVHLAVGLRQEQSAVGTPVVKLRHQPLEE